MGKIFNLKRTAFIIILFLFVMNVFNFTSVYATEVSRTDMVKTLVSKGDSEKWLNNLSDKQLKELYQLYQDPKFEITCQENKKTLYFKNDKIQTRGQIEEDALTIWSFTRCVWNASKQTLISMYADYEWNWDTYKPYVRNIDAVTINWDANAFVEDGINWLRGHYQTIDGDYVIFDEHSSWAQANQGGVGFCTDLTSLTDPLLSAKVSKIGGRVNFTLSPKITITKSSAPQQINFNYTHNKNPLPFTPSFSLSGLGVSVNESAMYDTQAFIDTIHFANY